MEHKIHKRTITFVDRTGWNGSGRPLDVVFTREVKRRLPATPFGFGLTFEGFSPRQLAILTALGLSKGK